MTLLGVLERTQMYSKKPISKPVTPITIADTKSILTPSLKKVIKKKALPLIKEKLPYNFSVPQSLYKKKSLKKSASFTPTTNTSSPFSSNKQMSSEESSSDFDSFDNLKKEIKKEPGAKIIEKNGFVILYFFIPYRVLRNSVSSLQILIT